MMCLTSPLATFFITRIPLITAVGWTPILPPPEPLNYGRPSPLIFLPDSLYSVYCTSAVLTGVKRLGGEDQSRYFSLSLS